MSREVKLFLRSTATVMVVLAMLFAFAISGVRLFGLQVYGVLTGSMEPSYPTGALVYVKSVDPATLKVSDVITFSMSRNVVATHRIVEKVPDPDNPYSYSFRTKGDANESVDNALVRQSNIIGKVVFSLPLMGYVASYIQNPPGTYVAILISLILIAFVFITDSVDEKASHPKRKKSSHLLPPSVRKKMTAIAETYLPFLRKRKPVKNTHRHQGYTPGQQSDDQQYPRYPRQQAAQPSQQHFSQQHQYPRQQYQPYPQQAQYPLQQPAQQYQQYQYPQQQYQPYAQQQVQYPAQQSAQQYPQQQYLGQQYQPYSQQQVQYPQQPTSSQNPQMQDFQRQYPQQYAQYQQPPQYPQQYPRQNPYDQLPPQQEGAQPNQPRRSRAGQNNAGYRQ